jgi:hypothetical protein
VTQLSLIPALEAARASRPLQAGQASETLQRNRHEGEPMSPPNRPTLAQVSYLKKLTGIRTDAQLARYVLRKIGGESGASSKPILTRRDFAKAIDLEVSEKRWTH